MWCSPHRPHAAEAEIIVVNLGAVPVLTVPLDAIGARLVERTTGEDAVTALLRRGPLPDVAHDVEDAAAPAGVGEAARRAGAMPLVLAAPADAALRVEVSPGEVRVVLHGSSERLKL